VGLLSIPLVPLAGILPTLRLPFHTLPAEKGAVCCVRLFLFCYNDTREGLFYPLAAQLFSLPPKLQMTRGYLPAYGKYFSFHFLQNRKSGNGR